MPVIQIDASATINPLLPAVPGMTPFIVGYKLQGVTADETVQFQNTLDNSVIDTVQCSTSGGGAYWQEQAETRRGQEGGSIKLVWTGANRVIGSVTVSFR
jgi:hypothetical protein